MIRRNEIDLNLVSEWLSYDSESGLITRKKSPKIGVISGDCAGTSLLNGCGNEYKSITIKGKRYLAHRVAYAIYNSVSLFGVIDHINGNGLDNRICNLRCTTTRQNARNMRMSSRCKTGIMGVSYDKKYGGWVVKIGRNGDLSKRFYFRDLFSAACKRKSLENQFNFDKNHGVRK